MNACKRIAAAGTLLAAMALPSLAAGPGDGIHRGMRMGPDNTAGWAMMTPAERKEHREKMQGMQSHEACTSYMEEHHKMMEERAKQKGRTLPTPRHNACDMMMKPAAAPSPKK
jgi:hypothetical protein